MINEEKNLFDNIKNIIKVIPFSKFVDVYEISENLNEMEKYDHSSFSDFRNTYL